jgi:hypothetical protein
MKKIGLFIGFLAVLAFMLPGLPAQDEKKKEAEKTDKKDPEKKDEKKDPEKKDEKKDPEKKSEKKVEPKKEKLVYGNKFYTKILGFKGDSNRDLTIETQVIDEKKVQDMQNWSAQRQQQLGQQYAKAAMIQKIQDRINALNAWQKDSANYQQELAKRQSNVYSPRSMEVKAHETAKVRALTPPVEFDDLGVQKKWTKKDLEERKDKTGLPGFPVEFDALKSGQYVEIYMAKVAPMTKKKKGPDDDDPPAMKDRNEFVLIVITQDAK